LKIIGGANETMDEQELIRLGMFTQELRRLQQEYGFWLQNAEVFSLTQADPLAKLGAGGGDYYVEILSK
jgi:hypothetical protein